MTVSVVAVASLWLGGALAAEGQGPATWSALPDSATVGDTIYLSRTLPAPSGVQARARRLSRTPVVEPLADPVVTHRGNLLAVRYAVAVFEPGVQAVPMPPVELFYADGNSETILGDTARVRVRSVLPRADTLPSPRPSLGPLARPVRRTTPVVLLVGLVIAGSALWGVARRRVGSRLPPEEGPGAATLPPLAAWVEAGELRAVATEVSMALRRQLARYVPDATPALSADACLDVLRGEHPAWPLEQLADVLHALDRARFAPAVPQDVMALAKQARTLIEQLAREA